MIKGFIYRPLFVCLAFLALLFGLLCLSYTAGAGPQGDADIDAINVHQLLTPEEIRWLSNHPSIRIAGPKAFPPFHYYDDKGDLKGMASDYIRFISNLLNIRLEIHGNLPWPDVLEQAKTHQIDLISCVAKTTDRERFLGFSDPYLSFPLVIITKINAPFVSGLDDLHDKTVAFIRGAAAYEWIQRDKIQAIPHFVKTPIQALQAVSLGHADAHIENLAAAAYLIEEQGLANLKIAAPTDYGNYNLYFAARKDWPELISILNKVLSQITPQQHSQIRNRWIAIPYEGGVHKSVVIKWVIGTAILAFMVMAVILLWNRRLRREITQRQRAEERLVFTQFAIDHFSDPAFWMGPDARFIYVNKSACHALGYTENELLSMTVHDIDPDFPITAWPDHWAELKQKRFMTIESQHRTKQGRVFPVKIAINHIEFHGKEYNCAFARDISQERIDRRSLKMRLDLIEFAADHTLDELLTRALDEIVAFVESPIGFFHFVNPDQRTLALQQWSTRTLKEFCQAKGHGLHYDINDAGVWVDCVKTKTPIVHNDYAALPHKKGMPEGHADIVRELVVPVIRENKVVAILGVGNKSTLYNQKDIDAVSYLADVTWQIVSNKRAEYSLQKSEARFRGVVEDTPVLICSFQPGGEITYVNKTYCDYFGMSVEDLVGSNFLVLIPESDRKVVMANISALTVESPTQINEHQVIAPGGDIRWQRWINRALFDAKGRITAYQAIGEDITEHQLAKQDLEKAIQDWQKTFNAVNAAIWILDRDQCVMRSNQAAGKLFNQSSELMIGKKCWEIVHDDDHPISLCPLPRARKSFKREMMEQQHDKGWFEITVDPIIDSAGQYAGAVHIVTDITDRKKGELEKEKLHSQLLQSQKIESVGRLAGGVAHDFNNMLGVIMGHAELAMDRIDAALPEHEDLYEIWKAAQRSADLTRQLLAFARRQTAIPKVLDLNDTVSGMLKMLRRLIGEDIDLAWMPGANLWPVKIDPAQVDQILANLSVNARDAIEGVGKITIETRNMSIDSSFRADHPEFVPGDYVMLVVSDDGCGMEKEVQDAIFEPFFTTKEAGRGTGLGLATVYGIIKQNDGFIHVYSEPGQGTSFKLYLLRSHETIEAVKEIIEEERITGTETVLVVEDEVSILRLATTLLERSGYTVLAARTPSEALALAKRSNGSIDLLLTDVIMPEMDGKELETQVKAIAPRIKVLFMSGYTSDVILHRGILQGHVNFLQKPFSVHSLNKKVREVLDMSLQ